jgi:UDP-N-acetyl-2-amino-2-deoxyglucuronate dehydrogenase
LRFGIIGCGRIAERHIASIASIKEASLVAVSDIVVENMAKAESQYHVQAEVDDPLRKYKDYQVLIADPDVDVVVVASLSGLHAEMARAALRAGKHVVLEKPMTLSLGEADELIALAEAQKRTLLVCHQLRYRPIMQTIKTYLERQALGRIYLGVVTMRIHRSADYYTAASWRGSWREDGGMLLNQGIHMVDLLQWFLGDVKTVVGDLLKGPIPKETEDVALGLLTFENGAKGMIEANTITYPNNLDYSLTLFGETGTISIGGPQLDRIDRWACHEQWHGEERLAALAQEKDEHHAMYRDLMDTLSDRKSDVLIHGREGRRALETIFAIYQSAAMSQPVTLPLTDFRTADLRNSLKRSERSS